MSVFQEALAPLSAKLNRFPVAREVLRCKADVPKGTDPLLVRQEVIRWAAKRLGVRLDDDAVQGKPFEHFVGGRTCVAESVVTEAGTLWSLSLDDPDKTVPGRTWTTEVTLGSQSSDCIIGVRLLATSSEADLNIVPAVPGFMAQIAQTIGLRRDGRALGQVWDVQDDAEAEALIDFIEAPTRQLPIIVQSEVSGQDPALDLPELARHLAGLAHVVRLSEVASWTLTKAFSKVLSVFQGAIRLYEPSFSVTDDPYSHRLYLTAFAGRSFDVDTNKIHIRRSVAERSLRLNRLGNDVLTFADVRRAARKVEAQRLLSSGTGTGAQLEYATRRIQELESELEKEKAVANDFAMQFDAIEEDSKALKARLHAAQERIAALERGAGSANTALALPTTWGDFETWCNLQLATKVRLEPAARRSVRSFPAFSDVGQAARCLIWLADVARPRFLGSAGGSIRDIPVEDGLRNAPCGGDEFFVGSGADRITINWHIKNGGNTRDPVRCLRIYWGWDDQTQEIVIADMPGHRVTDATREKHTRTDQALDRCLQ